MEDILFKDQDLWSVNASLENSSLANATREANGTVNPVLRNEEVAKVEVTVLALILLLALTGNLCVLLAIYTTKNNQSRMYFFMKHLSIADLVVAIFQVLPQLIWDITFRFYGPDFLCRLVKYLQVVGMFASTYMLVLMSIDRCLAICQPLRSLHRRADRFYIITSWVLSLLFSIPQVYIFSLREIPAGSGVYDCWGDFIQPWGAKAYVTWISLTIYIIPVAILSVCYGLISFKIWQNFKLKTRKDQSIPLTPKAFKGSALSRVSSVKLISKAKIRTVKMTFVIVLAYIVCWTPFFFVQMWSAWDPAAPREELAFIIAMLLASLNSCCNPWIYMFFAGHLFHDLMQHFLCCSASYLKATQCSCELDSSRKSNSSTYIIKNSSSQKSITQTSST
ncbi:oxytocin receptor [Lepisosteus oculatus]|uniref:Oxytocin receptor b n=1 Tax=Lepisosteus oculatus TaxID=7918 RepID=W5MXC6_LEPOC|nr:PREDICTED: isotocin receptor-like [Lepisosteus oculatus]XP_015202803.1 PREDICTED: isotocin receptor-like [Lepisosteus oculatus]